MSDRPEPVRCRKCHGFVFSPAAGESAEIVRKVARSDQADPGNQVCACAKCGNLYELKIQEAA